MNKALYLGSNPSEVPVIIVRVLILLYVRLNLAKGFPTHKRDYEKYLINFAYRRKPKIQLKLYNLVLKLVAFPVVYVRLRYP